MAVRSLLAAQEAKTDLLIIDTAGRQANKRNLLLELGKIKRSLQKKAEARAASHLAGRRRHDRHAACLRRRGNFTRRSA